MKSELMLVSALALTVSAFAAEKKDKDPRETYSKDGWKLAWSEEFDKPGLVDEKTWDYEVGFIRNQEDQWYQPANAICRDGCL